ncbi:bone morphogenetic protein receptor type-2-like [Eucyclogobius newberryi]|uniref:bone morphogenetic protein receptor type-2-like n=1 Tax=Eucyclogobius newberryi TaxID=166745 RepID=UPI003B5AD28A
MDKQPTYKKECSAAWWCEGGVMDKVGGASTVLIICSLLLPSVIGTRSEVRECVFSERLHGARASRTSRDNSTVHCSRGHVCFGLWEHQSGGGVVLLKQGCWTSQPDCLSDHCLVLAPPSHIHRGGYRFCCCSRSLCNRDFIEAPVTAAAPVRQHTDDTPPGQRSALVAVGMMAGALTLVCLLFCGYGVLTGKKKLSLGTLNVPETSNASCVNMDELKLWEMIGRGRYSCVYRGTLSERSVAVKLFSSAHRHKYINECYTYSLLSLRQQLNTARFLCADERVDSEGCTQHLIVMELYPHGCLSHFLSHSSVDWSSCCRMMLGVTRGLSFLHSELLSGDESKPALSHRDVSSSNVLVHSDLSCVLADFSLCMRLTRDPSRFHGDRDSVAISEVGTLRYLAPELLAGALDLREFGTALKQVDVYALGMLFWESFRRCHDLFPGRSSPHFQLAFEMELGQEPTLEDMHMLVVRDKGRPGFPAEWQHNGSVLRLLKETVEDCWDQDAEARLSAHCAEERLCQLSLLSVPTPRPHRPLDDLLEVEGANGQAVPYLGYISLNITFPPDFLGTPIDVATLALSTMSKVLTSTQFRMVIVLS